MEIKFNEHGDFMILENGFFQAKACPHREEKLCGDWCRLLILDHEAGTFDLCSEMFFFTSFTDERV